VSEEIQQSTTLSSAEISQLGAFLLPLEAKKALKHNSQLTEKKSIRTPNYTTKQEKNTLFIH
jgi:hypothetical protein